MKLRVGQYRFMRIGVLTSGDDTQGINAALRAIVRTGIFTGCDVFFIREGYRGLVSGGTNIRRARWADVSGIILSGGTTIGSAKSDEFSSKAGRTRAAKNLIKRKIDRLIVIGGDGTLTGGELLQQEWSEHVKILLEEGEICGEEAQECASILVVGMVASIENDFYGMDYTIGTSSALSRIQEAADAVSSTAYSHRRTFILEVMGRRCGYLALASSILAEADYVFFPERPPPENWKEDMCAVLERVRKKGQRLSIVVVADGATDQNGDPITSKMIKGVIDESCYADTRITVLAQVQRGGIPTALDRIVASKLGVSALISVCKMKPNDRTRVVAWNREKVVGLDMNGALANNEEIGRNLKDRNWQEVAKLRGETFGHLMNAALKVNPLPLDDKRHRAFAIVLIGGIAAGMNAIMHAFVRRCVQTHNIVYGVHDGICGFTTGFLEKLTWESVTGWIGMGGSNLETKRWVPNDEQVKQIAQRLEEYKIEGLAIAGGYDAFKTCQKLLKCRDEYPALKIPIALIPVTPTNNVPGAKYAIGFDTSVNGFLNICDSVRRMASGSKRSVFLTEISGDYNSALASCGALASGADYAYTYGMQISVNKLMKDLYDLASKMTEGPQRGVVIKTSKASVEYDTDFFYKLYSEEGYGMFKAVKLILDDTYQGGIPSVIDRVIGYIGGQTAFEYLLEMAESEVAKKDSGGESVFVLNLERMYSFEKVPVAKLSEELTDLDRQRRLKPGEQPTDCLELIRLLGTHDSAYTPDMEIELNDDYDMEIETIAIWK